MNIINLPPVLSGELDLRDLNLQLQTGEATLDWSNVQDAPESALAILLAGLDIVEQSEELGLETVPDALAEAVLRVLSRQKNAGTRQRRGQQTTASTSPANWELEQQGELHGAAVPVDEALATVAMPASLPASPRSVLQPPGPSVLRDELERLVLQDLRGPAGGPEEELEEGSVRDRYLVGMLAPRDQQIVPEEMDELAIPEEGSSEDGPNDDTALQTASLCPSSLGMSFCVDGAASLLRVTAGWGYYRREHSEMLKTPKGAAKTVWKRQAMGGEPHIFLLPEGSLKPWSPEPEEQPDVVVRGIVRRTEDFWTVTLFLVNEQREPEKRRDEAWVFQPELSVEAPDGAPIFQQRPTLSRRLPTDEELAMGMLYRRYVGFAIGHGVGVHAETVPGDSTRAVRLTTRVVPGYDVPRTEAPTEAEIPGLADLVLDMKELAASPMNALAAQLMPLVRAYAVWIDEQAARIDKPEEGLMAYQHVAESALEECRRTLERMRAGITLLSHNVHAARAFTFMEMHPYMLAAIDEISRRTETHV